MPTMTLAEDFLALFPDAMIGTVTVHGIDNTLAGAEAATMLAVEMPKAAKELPDEDLATHPAIAPWRAAYARFGVKPSKTRSSIENLLRSAKAQRLRSINPLVDLYNTVSLKHLLPVGGEDLATIVGDIVLTRATGDEGFVPLGGAVQEPPPAGAVIYRDDVGVICSCWNWREADRTKLTEGTTDALLVIEAVPPLGRVELEAALANLAERVTGHLGSTARVAILDRDSRTIELSAA
jgi:DNA/RNA-binding domain of Phe-tRNA-synthetase-like protein